MLEKDIVAAIKRYLSTLGDDVFFWKEHGGPYGVSGVPDIICCYRGRFLGLEAKLPGGRLTALQKRALERINRAGGIARRVESVDDVKAIIAQADRKTKEYKERLENGETLDDLLPEAYATVREAAKLSFGMALR